MSARRRPRRASSSGSGAGIAMATARIIAGRRDPSRCGGEGPAPGSGGLEAADRDQAPDLRSRLAVREAGLGLHADDLTQEEQRPRLRLRHRLVEEARDDDGGLAVGQRRIERLPELITQEPEVARLGEGHRTRPIFGVAIVVPRIETPRDARVRATPFDPAHEAPGRLHAMRAAFHTGCIGTDPRPLDREPYPRPMDPVAGWSLLLSAAALLLLATFPLRTRLPHGALDALL